MAQIPVSCGPVALIVLLGSVSLSVAALDESTLWLPAKYNPLYLRLKDAARAAEALPRCQRVLRGTLDIDQSTVERPIFRILCRQANGRSYNEMVDGTTMETLTTPAPVEEVAPVEQVLSEGDIEAQRIAEEARIAAEQAAHRARLWQNCLTAFEAKIHLMIGIEYRNEDRAEPIELNDIRAVFQIDFDAKDIEGQALHYRASCDVPVAVNEPALVVVKRREVAGPPGDAAQ